MTSKPIKYNAQNISSRPGHEYNNLFKFLLSTSLTQFPFLFHLNTKFNSKILITVSRVHLLGDRKTFFLNGTDLSFIFNTPIHHQVPLKLVLLNSKFSFSVYHYSSALLSEGPSYSCTFGWGSRWGSCKKSFLF